MLFRCSVDSVEHCAKRGAGASRSPPLRQFGAYTKQALAIASLQRCRFLIEPGRPYCEVGIQIGAGTVDDDLSQGAQSGSVVAVTADP